MIKFQHPEALYLLMGLVPLTGIFLWYMWARKKGLKKMGEESLVRRLTPNKPSFKHQLKFIFICLTYTSLVFCPG